MSLNPLTWFTGGPKTPEVTAAEDKVKTAQAELDAAKKKAADDAAAAKDAAAASSTPALGAPAPGVGGRRRKTKKSKKTKTSKKTRSGRKSKSL